jgi:hypothetical protein
MKKKLLLVYGIAGCVWTIVNLPNLLERTNNSSIKATGLALFRIIAWPVLLGKFVYTKVRENTKQNIEEDGNVK